MRHSERCNVGRAGFTLLELIVVVSVISILLAIVFPSFYGLGESKLKSEGRRMASLLRYLNDNAIATKETYSLNLDLQERTVAWKGPEGEKRERFKSLASIHLESKGEVNEGQVVVFFGPLGIEESIAIRLREEEKALTVVLNRLSGRTKVIPEEEEEKREEEK